METTVTTHESVTTAAHQFTEAEAEVLGDLLQILPDTFAAMWRTYITARTDGATLGDGDWFLVLRDLATLKHHLDGVTRAAIRGHANAGGSVTHTGIALGGKKENGQYWRNQVLNSDPNQTPEGPVYVIFPADPGDDTDSTRLLWAVEWLVDRQNNTPRAEKRHAVIRAAREMELGDLARQVHDLYTSRRTGLETSPGIEKAVSLARAIIRQTPRANTTDDK